MNAIPIPVGGEPTPVEQSGITGFRRLIGGRLEHLAPVRPGDALADIEEAGKPSRQRNLLERGVAAPC